MHFFGDTDDEPTRPETPDALLARNLERFREAVDNVCTAIPLLSKLSGTEREYFGARLAEEFSELLTSGQDILTFIRVTRAH